MKKFVILSALAVALASVPTQEAAANGGGFNLRLGIGLNLMADWNAWCNPCHGGCGHGGHGFGGHGFGHGHHAMFGFPDGSYQYAGQHFTPPPPQPDNKGKDQEASYQNYAPPASQRGYSYPNLGYTVQPASYGYGYPQYYYYTPTLRFDQ